jgi:phage terminase large subunit
MENSKKSNAKIKKEQKVMKIVGQGYDDFWHFKGRYRVVKGSRASKKSKTAALWFIHHMMEFPEANLLVVRKTYNSLRHSCFTELKWAINRLGVSDEWQVKLWPFMEIRYNKGGTIFFRGLGDSMSLTSISAEKGKLCWVWVEEAFEIDSEDDFSMIDESIRGIVGKGLFKQITLTFNPWNEEHWLKKKFFDVQDGEVMAVTKNYTLNEYFCCMMIEKYLLLQYYKCGQLACKQGLTAFLHDWR